MFDPQMRADIDTSGLFAGAPMTGTLTDPRVWMWLLRYLQQGGNLGSPSAPGTFLPPGAGGLPQGGTPTNPWLTNYPLGGG